MKPKTVNRKTANQKTVKTVKNTARKTIKIQTKHASMILHGNRITKCHIDKTKYWDKFDCTDRNTAEFVCRLGQQGLGKDFAQAAEKQGIMLDSLRKQLSRDMTRAIHRYSRADIDLGIDTSPPSQHLWFMYYSDKKISSRVSLEEFAVEVDRHYKEGTYKQFMKSKKGKNVVKSFTNIIQKSETWTELFETIDEDMRPGGFSGEELSEWVSIRIDTAIKNARKIIMKKPKRRR